MVGVANEFLGQRVPNAVLDRTLPKTKIARVFPKHGGIEEVAEESCGYCVGQRSAIALAVSCGPLPVLRKFIFCLAKTRLKSDQAKLDGIKSRLRKQVKLVPGAQGRSILAAGDGKLRSHPQHPLRLLLL